VSRHLLQRLETDDIADSFSFLAPFIHGVYSDYARTYAAVMKQVKVRTPHHPLTVLACHP
jgi:hypothetical protein